MTQPTAGPLCAARNWSADAGAGSIHDDETAEKLGFRGGTVAGDVHVNQFPPVLLAVFGNAWFERGNLSLSFRNATVDRERVQVFAEPLAPGANQTRVWMEREDGMLMCSGNSALGDHARPDADEPALSPDIRGALRGPEPADRVRVVGDIRAQRVRRPGGHHAHAVAGNEGVVARLPGPGPYERTRRVVALSAGQAGNEAIPSQHARHSPATIDSRRQRQGFQPRQQQEAPE